MDEQEQAIWEGLGVTPDEEPEQTEQPEDTDTGDETDIPDGEDDGGEEPGGSGDGEEPAEDGGEDSDGPDPDEAHRQELERVRQEGKDALNAQVAGMGLKNPYDGNKPITTVEELHAYQDAAREANIQRICKAAGMSREDFDALVAGDPEVRAAKDAQARAQAAEQTAQEQQAAARLDAEIAQIRKLCPDIKDRESLVAHKSWGKVRDRMKDTGCGVLDAFRLENFEELRQQGVKNARRQAARNNRGKEHLKGTVGKGKGGASIPADQLRIYQHLNPGASLEELQAFHAANNKH